MLGELANTDECQEWDRQLRRGYGVLRDSRGNHLVHRLVWQEVHGAIGSGQCILHRCDNPACINVEHLFLGTRTDNSIDKCLKGRARGGSMPGETHPVSKLTNAQAAEIRELLREGRKNHREIASLYGVSRSTVTAIARGRRWRRVIG